MFNQASHKLTNPQRSVIALTIALTAGSLLYRVLMHQHLGHTAALFLGLPAVLAILLATTPEAKSATGAIVKGITLFVLIVAPLLGEGWVCILIASPLFYLVGIVIGAIADWQSRRRARTLSCLLVLLVPLSLEGVIPALTFPRQQTVEVRRVVNAPAAAVEAALGRSLDVATPLPLGLRIGFPRPIAAWGGGLAVGDTRVVRFSGAEGNPPGNLLIRVVELRPGYVRTESVSDGSKVTQWATWTGSAVSWRAIDATHTEVTWRLGFTRQLDPAWYFVPVERSAVSAAANYMIAANATPHGR